MATFQCISSWRAANILGLGGASPLLYLCRNSPDGLWGLSAFRRFAA